MKKIFAFILSATMLFSLAACAGGGKGNEGENGGNGNEVEESVTPEAPGDTMTTTEIAVDIVGGVETLPASENYELSADNFEAYAFVKYIEGATGTASEALINAIAHSVVVVRVPDGEDAQAVAADIKANANPRKWICVEAEKTIVEVHNQTILLVMSSAENADAVAANFNALWA